jgi:putative transposase
MATRVHGSKNRFTITLFNDVIISVGQSLTHLLVHAIFSTKDRRPFLRSEEIRTETYAYMAGTLKNLDRHPIKIGGVEDHVHVFSSLSKNIAFSDLIGRLKGASSKRLKEKTPGF